MATVLESLGNFLRVRAETHNAPELLARWTPAMETQVNVSAGHGEPVAGKRSTYSDGLDTWWNIRVPRKADSEPEFRDYELNWLLGEHAEGIGCTGWDWQTRCSRWLGFDFDSITGHAAGVGVTDQELERVREAASALPWVEVRRSTGGKGLHLYVLLDAIPTKNHTEHAALGRAVLGWMSSETGFDFASQIDACGGNMWIYHRKMTPGNQGLKLLKHADQVLTIDDLPPNWRDHIDVVTRRRKKLRVQGISNEAQDPFDALTSSRQTVELDEKHKRIIDELGRSGFSAVWVHEHHLLQAHTCAFAKIADNKELGIIGVFQTNSAGRDPGTPNCFAFPLENGGWKVYRFSQGINEAETWTQDKEGWTTCHFNRYPDWDIAAVAYGGAKLKKGGYSFDTAADALKAAAAAGEKIELPEKMLTREAQLQKSKDGYLVVEVKQVDNEAKPGPRWAAEKGWWSRVTNVKTEQRKDEADYAEYDNIVRQLVTPNGNDAGWKMRTVEGFWQNFQTDKVKMFLQSLGNTEAEAKNILGVSIRKPWQLVNLPFQAEYPGSRQWNVDAAQYAFEPAKLDDDEPSYHPHWDKILNHCGRDLDDALRQSEWAQQFGIKTGADYLLYWTACLLRDPFSPLPYLFFWGSQNCGKSIFHQALRRLMTKGCASADRALTNSNDFNGELANIILAYIEEKDISTAPGAYNKIKDWVTSEILWIRKMRTDAYPQANTLHFVQCANKPEFCPMFPGDSRITMIHVDDLELGAEIPKDVLIKQLEIEAPHFMRTLMQLELPKAAGRLRLPVVRTDSKEQAESDSQTVLERFIQEHCFYAPGEYVELKEFRKRFEATLSSEELHFWTQTRVSQYLPRNFARGKHNNNITVIGNISFIPPDPNVPPKQSFVSRGGRVMVPRIDVPEVR